MIDDDKLLQSLVGHIFAERDESAVQAGVGKGIKEIFGPGSSVSELANYIRDNVRGEDL